MSTHSVAERVRSLVEPILAAHELELVDVEHTGPSLKLTVDRAGGVDLDAISAATKMVSRVLDEVDPISGRYTLEVSSPGLERSLRTPAQYGRAVGEKVKVKLTVGPPNPASSAASSPEGSPVTERRLTGTLASATDDGFALLLDDGTQRRFAYDQVERARTVFEWGPAPKPGKKEQTR